MSYVPESSVNIDKRNLHPSMKFRAVIAGWLIATGVAGLLYVAGLALGFSSFDAWNAAGSAKGIGIGTAIWMIITWVAALFLGGMFASWFDGRNDDTMGALHGVTVWGLSVTMTALWLALGLGHSMSGHGSMMGMHADGDNARGGNPSAMAGGGAVAVLDANIAFQLTGREHGVSAPIVAALIANHDDTASALLAADTGTTQASAAQALQRLSPQIGLARAEAKMTADRTAHYLAMTLWVAFISSFLALLAAAIGGWLGASHIHHVYHLRKYPARPTSRVN
ncbi:hypothetical protein [Rhodanobacter sp. C05]|uniref:hypothetical protein n=1 Tax=Rhodanobacter sp. C05 TaxID=1945855 RepID=UPI00098494C0|nr:hypothetical protein [Rhodanobacter sp. C05]OOG41365.1 hypothetical protein B0E51_06560 [Rhodanobacter sp. C05]